MLPKRHCGLWEPRRCALKKVKVVLLSLFVLWFCVTVVFALPWSRDMYNLPSIWPFERVMPAQPEGTLPVTGGELAMTREEASEDLRNPAPSTPESIAEGQELFKIYCVVCHGPEGKGDGPIAAKLTMPPADLTADLVKERSDGFIYATIRSGGVLMPAMGSSLSETERWAVVNYVRNQQN